MKCLQIIVFITLSEEVSNKLKQVNGFLLGNYIFLTSQPNALVLRSFPIISPTTVATALNRVKV